MKMELPNQKPMTQGPRALICLGVTENMIDRRLARRLDYVPTYVEGNMSKPDGDDEPELEAWYELPVEITDQNGVQRSFRLEFLESELSKDMVVLGTRFLEMSNPKLSLERRKLLAR